MSTRKQREILRQRRVRFAEKLAENRAENEKSAAIGKMTKAQLIDYADEKGIEIDKTAKKDEILTVIKEQEK